MRLPADQHAALGVDIILKASEVDEVRGRRRPREGLLPTAHAAAIVVCCMARVLFCLLL